MNLASLPLGMAIAAMGAWFAIQGGSIIDLSIGFVILLAGLAILRSHSVTDFFFLTFLVFAMTAWSISRIDAGIRILNSVVELSGRINLVLGLLVIMGLAPFVMHWHRISAGVRPVLAASSKASVTPEWTMGSNMAAHPRQQNS